ncbi:hypothetical protein DFH27DRAFT_314024 [Peziza echinospora]|nr:hypothetical protein DFH27DRAFT_314024 [Peziza echinospora]
MSPSYAHLRTKHAIEISYFFFFYFFSILSSYFLIISLAGTSCFHLIRRLVASVFFFFLCTDSFSPNLNLQYKLPFCQGILICDLFCFFFMWVVFELSVYMQFHT